jgi:DNA-binding MarR family transcriptional regulator
MGNSNKIGFEIKTLSNLITRRIDKFIIGSGIDKLTGMHSWVIGYLCHNQDKDIFQRDIEAEFSIRRSTVTGILQLMEKNNLIIRESVDYDARLKKLVLTKKAIEIHNMIENDISKMEAKLSNGLTPEEISLFFLLMEKVKKNLE